MTTPITAQVCQIAPPNIPSPNRINPSPGDISPNRASFYPPITPRMTTTAFTPPVSPQMVTATIETTDSRHATSSTLDSTHRTLGPLETRVTLLTIIDDATSTAYSSLATIGQQFGLSQAASMKVEEGLRHTARTRKSAPPPPRRVLIHLQQTPMR